MSREVIDRVRGVLTGSGAKGSTRLVLTILATYADAKGCACPAVGTIAALANVSVRQVQLDLRKLTKCGEIVAERIGGGRKRTTIYRITLKPCSPFQLAEKVKSMKGVSRHFQPGAFTGERVNTCSPEVLRGHGASRAALSLSLYSQHEREIIELYHSKLVGLGRGWLKVTTFTEPVREAIALFPLNDWRELFDAYANAPDTWPQSKTLVRLAWHHYHGE